MKTRQAVTRQAERLYVRKPVCTPREAAARARRTRFLQVALAVGVPVALLLLWQMAAASGWIDRRLFPAPTTIARTAWDLIAAGELWTDVLATLRRVVLGFAIGGLVGFLAGAVTGLSRLARSALEPMLSALYVVPKLALLPVFITIAGLGEPPVIVMVSWTVFFYIWIYTMEAFTQIPEGYREAARSLNVGRRAMFRHVLLPAALPHLFVAMRVAISVAILVIVAAEFVVGTTGLGYVIFDSRRLFMNDRMYVGIVTVALLGVILATMITWIGRRLTPWAEQGRPRV